MKKALSMLLLMALMVPASALELSNPETIDGAIIGGTTPAAVTGTTITGTSLDCNGAADISGNLVMSGSGNTTLTGTLALGVATGNATITTGNINLTVTVGGETYYIKAHTSE